MIDQVQIIGTPKCKDTQKALRFFKERRIKVHFLDLNVKGISKGELNNISRNIPIDELIDTNSKEFKRLNLQYMVYNTEDILLENSLLLKTPIIRFGKRAIVGYDDKALKEYIKSQD